MVFHEAKSRLAPFLEHILNGWQNVFMKYISVY